LFERLYFGGHLRRIERRTNGVRQAPTVPAGHR